MTAKTEFSVDDRVRGSAALADNGGEFGTVVEVIPGGGVGMPDGVRGALGQSAPKG